MHLLRLISVCAIVLSTTACADLYYRMLGERGWPHQDHTLYTRLGGQDGIDRLTVGWVDAAGTDPRISHYFEHADKKDLEGSIAEQLCVLTGGPCVYTGRGMTDVHTGLAISDADFDAFLDDLRSSLASEGRQGEPEQQLIDELQALRPKIVTVQS